MRLVWRGDGVVDTHPHGGMNGQVRERVGGAPGCLLRFDPVRAGLLWVRRCGGDGVEAQRQLLVNGAVGVQKDMGGVAVDTGEPNQSVMATPDSSATSRITAWAADSPTSRRPPGNSQ